MERGERFPSAGILQKIAGPLSFDVNELFILAGYLPPQPDSVSEPQSNYNGGKLDSFVSHVLVQEPVEV
jgi:transcriptional regulator with XRE-family HTH domain